jgi:hypothetical protein
MTVVDQQQEQYQAGGCQIRRDQQRPPSEPVGQHPAQRPEQAAGRKREP